MDACCKRSCATLRAMPITGPVIVTMNNTNANADLHLLWCANIVMVPLLENNRAPAD